MSGKLLKRDIEEAALELGVEPASVWAVTEVESNGGGFYEGGMPKILFERHVMYRLYKDKFGAASAADAFKKYPQICNPTSGGYGPSIDQPLRMDSAAKLLDRDCALQSASWGMFQIMGYHWKSLGFLTLQAFVNAMYASEGAQLKAFVEFIRNDSKLHAALKSKDWEDFACRYNGPKFKDNNYDVKLAKAYDKHTGAV